jgi:hypothetical protein
MWMAVTPQVSLELLEQREAREARRNPAVNELMADLRMLVPERLRVWWNNRLT